MKILIAVDMEGITGVVNFDQVTPGAKDYERFCKLMTADVNAAIRGAFAGGATEVVVSDGHWFNTNIIIEELDARARLNSGAPRPFAMVQGIDDGVKGVLLVGYHARVGTADAILDHTWSSARIAGLRLNGDYVGEIGFNAAVCGHFGAPVLMISGDQTACAEATALLGDVEIAVVKHATGRTSAELLPPAMTLPLIERSAQRAVARLTTGQGPRAYVPSTPVTLEVEFMRSDQADAASVLPGTRRAQGKQVVYVAPDILYAYRAFRALVGLAPM